MITVKNLRKQLKAINYKVTFFGYGEVVELAKTMNKGEVVKHCVYGFYQGGTALFVATNSRLLLIDKRPFFLNLEDLRYEMISEVDFAGRLLDAKVNLYTGSKSLYFRSFYNKKLRKLCTYIQNQITRARRLEHRAESDRSSGIIWRPYFTPERSKKIGKLVVQPMK